MLTPPRLLTARYAIPPYSHGCRRQRRHSLLLRRHYAHDYAAIDTDASRASDIAADVTLSPLWRYSAAAFDTLLMRAKRRLMPHSYAR